MDITCCQKVRTGGPSLMTTSAGGGVEVRAATGRATATGESFFTAVVLADVAPGLAPAAFELRALAATAAESRCAATIESFCAASRTCRSESRRARRIRARESRRTESA